MTKPQPYVPTAREQKFLESVEEARYERGIISGLGPFFNRLVLRGKVAENPEERRNSINYIRKYE